MAVLYARQSAREKIRCLGHYFNPDKTLENKLALAASNYELTQSLPLIVSYLGGDSPRPVFEAIAAHEAKLAKILLDYLVSKPNITVYGETTPDSSIRVPTISFTVNGVSSQKIVEDVEKISNLGMRWGHVYSKRLCDEILKLGPEGVVRVSFVHYNSEEEARKVVEVLEKVIPKE